MTIRLRDATGNLRFRLLPLVAALVLAGCNAPAVTPSPTQNVTPAPVQSPVAMVPSPTASTTIPVPTTTAVPPPRDLTGPVALTDMTADDRYKGEDGGLYGKGRNEPPPQHDEAALKAIDAISPLDGDGNPSPAGKIGLISIGMSNTTQEFSLFKRLAEADAEKRPEVVVVDGAQGGQTARIWSAQEAPWQVLAQRLKAAGVTAAQVQVVWMKQANSQPARPFPAEAKDLQVQLAIIVQKLKQRYPNVRLVYLSSRTYGGYATTPLNPEPHAFESAFAIRWMVQAQMNGDPALNYDANKGPVNAPLLLWGPYLWADGLTARSDGLVWERGDLSAADGTHPSDAGRRKVAEMLLRFFKTNDLAQGWFVKP